VFTEPLPRNGLHNPRCYIVACWNVFTEPLPGNALIKSVTILIRIFLTDFRIGKLRKQWKAFLLRHFYKINSDFEKELKYKYETNGAYLKLITDVLNNYLIQLL
jgi:hypothetical protein